MTECRRVQAILEAFADGELSPDRVLEAEEHIERCELCSERLRFDYAVRISTQRVVRAVVAPEALRARIGAALVAERVREHADDSVRRTRPTAPMRWLPWRGILPLATAAAVVLLWASLRAPSGSPVVTQAAVHSMPTSGSPTHRLEQLLEDFVDHHSRAPKPQITEPSLVSQLEPQVGVPLRVPALSQYGAYWEGGGVVAPERGPRAVSLRYRLGNHRITVYVYDSSRFPLRATLEPRVVRNLPVYVGARRGYSIAAAERRGIGYALATDLGYDESAELAAALAQNSEEVSSQETIRILRAETQRF